MWDLKIDGEYVGFVLRDSGDESIWFCVSDGPSYPFELGQFGSKSDAMDYLEVAYVAE